MKTTGLKVKISNSPAKLVECNLIMSSKVNVQPSRN